LIAAVGELAEHMPVSRACEALGLNRSSYYREKEIAATAQGLSGPAAQAQPCDLESSSSGVGDPVRADVPPAAGLHAPPPQTRRTTVVDPSLGIYADFSDIARHSHGRCDDEEKRHLRSRKIRRATCIDLHGAPMRKYDSHRSSCALLKRFRRPNRQKTSPDSSLPRKRHHRRLSEQDEACVLAYLMDPAHADMTPLEVYYTLLCLGIYLCSSRTMARMLQRLHMSEPRRRGHIQRRHRKPELLATGPNQVWSWDITNLPSCNRDEALKLYVVMDIYSRYVVGWMIADSESGELASEFMQEVLLRTQAVPDSLVIHSDRGAPMTSAVFRTSMSQRGVALSYSRPRVSNDNPFSEALFKTAKYSVGYPGIFSSAEEARAFCTSFFGNYNEKHHHSGLHHHTPSTVHYGRAQEVTEQRQCIFDEAYERHPNRFVHGPAKAKLPPLRVAINLPCGPVPPPHVEPHAASHEVRPSQAAPTAARQVKRTGPRACPLMPTAHLADSSSDASDAACDSEGGLAEAGV
jgi:putative transposase